ncbi:MAG: cupin domain-containing protein [Rhizobiaceae bacterium]|nr:cupin domain-containing protein [Rhizobiaceae bacterium]
MTGTFEKAAFSAPIDQNEVKELWRQEGFDFGIFRDPPGQEWNDFVHGTDEYVLVAQGNLTISVGIESADCQPGDLVRIPRGISHSLKTTSPSGSVWFYGYGHWGKNT